MQLVAYGAQDIYLTGNPQITFFKVVYRRHTNFSMEEIVQTPNGAANYGQTASYTISRNGDLVHKMYFEFTPEASADGTSDKYAPHIGHTLLKEVECEIGGQKIDKHYSHWLATWNQLSDVNPTGASAVVTESGSGVSEPTSGATLYQVMSFNHKGAELTNKAIGAVNGAKAMVPLQFWFNRNPGLALPLIALQYHEVKIKITFCGKEDVASGNAATKPVDGKLYAQYIYLDTDERRRFAQVSHEYLIEQLQFQDTTVQGSMNLNFNHPVKEVIWGKKPQTTPTSFTAVAGPAIFQAPGVAANRTFHLKLNGHDRFAPRSDTYFTRQQVYDHHSGFGGTVVRDSIFVYSFALKPEEHQPSGTCNFSRIDTAQLVMGGDAITGGLYIYAVNYNVLRIMSGMGGLAYSN